MTRRLLRLSVILSSVWLVVNVIIASRIDSTSTREQRQRRLRVLLSDTPAALVLQDVYFGVGCYWHIQHEFVQAERLLLGRGDHELTARTGYAGSVRTGPDGRVCYHNFLGYADYEMLGHAEVVGLKLPKSSIVDFAQVYFGLFDPETKDRVDPQDKGPEYRALVGLPGGLNHSEYPAIESLGMSLNFTLQLGDGGDPDTLGKNGLVYVYDSIQFTFHQAEVFMQFHDDFQSDPYGSEYNKLMEQALEDGRILGQGCPDRL